MAEDNGAGLFGLGPTPGIVEAVRAQAAALAVQQDSLKEYKGMVDALLEELGGSEADHKRLANGTLTQAALGHGFAEATAIYASYNTVTTELEKLSKGLAGQIEALGIAVLSAGKGYAGVDLDTQRRMAAIAKEAERDYVRSRDPHPEERPKNAGDAVGVEL
ncbi:hypothetical protein [Streptomyces sp. NPDC002044]|uniref:hypothetical protein n=1 Tax=Streptomyces sp. NPDC002044 TaxID=3154662 RepID=UPI00331EA213